MPIFIVLLGALTGILWLVPKYGRSRNRDLIALKSSGAGCLSLIAVFLIATLAVRVFRLPAYILPMFIIAFFTLPLIAALFSAFLAVKVFRKHDPESAAPSIRAILYYILLGIAGSGIWFGEKSIEMSKEKEVWSVEYSTPSAGLRKVAVTLRLANPVVGQYEGTLRVTSADGKIRTAAFPRNRFDGRELCLYSVQGIPAVEQPLFLAADNDSAYLADPATMRILPVERKGNAVMVGKQDITSWGIFNRAVYLGVFRDGGFLTPAEAKEPVLRVMYGNRKSAADPGKDRGGS